MRRDSQARGVATSVPSPIARPRANSAPAPTRVAGEHVLDRFLNILPTVTIREGTRIKVYLSNDLLLPDHAAHNVPSDI